jgi:PEP-CTERM motif-containing protein
VRLSVVRCLGLLLLAVVGVASRADAALVTVPPSLTTGDTYRLVFVTSTTRDATSTSIADYNTHVSDAANAVPELAALGATWKALASTAGTNAIANVGVSLPSVGIFRFDGTKVADGLDSGVGLYGGFILVQISINELGLSPELLVWTGTDQTGTAALADRLGTPTPLVGDTRLTSRSWTDGFFSGSTSSATLMPVYGISSELTVPVPEPGTIGLTALGVAFLFLARRRKQQKDQAT